MKKISLFLAICLLGFVYPLLAQKITLPNGWSLTPVGKYINLSSDLPLNMVFTPNHDYLAITNNGNGTPTIDLIDVKQNKLIASKKIKNAWLGLAFSKGYLYTSGANDNSVIRYKLIGHQLINKDTLIFGKPWPKEKICPAGLTIDDRHDVLYVVTKEDNSLYICNSKTMTLINKVALPAEAYTCILNNKKHELYISLWGAASVLIYNTERNKITGSIKTEEHPSDLVLDKKGNFLYTANANSNSVSVINLNSQSVIETLSTAINPNAPIGSTTNSVALSTDNKTLYIANADNNYLAVFDVSQPGESKSKGFIPVGWYPTCVRVFGNNIYVTNGKGMSSGSNVKGKPTKPMASNAKYKQGGGIDKKTDYEYIGSMLKGTLSIIKMPNAVQQLKYTRQVYKNTPYSKKRELEARGQIGNPIPTKIGGTSPIKYVFYVLKENRTYDQVLGDMPQGNGDTSLCLFGKDVTPNAHALSADYVLFDNFYVDGEVSADGHNWSMSAYATDFTEKTWPTNYRGGGGNYDFDGRRAIANPVKGFIWDYCIRAGVSFRNYGEFMDDGPASYETLKDEKYYCKNYPHWDLRVQDVLREKIFEHDFDSLLVKNQVPRFSTIYLPNDHTSGTDKGAYTPTALVADNDLALGRLVEHISHSAIWNQSAIFVLEDDAQDGPDHVDAHRSVAYVISPFVKRHQVNHNLYSTSGMLRTMELILGLPPMSQYDAAANPLWVCFQPTADTTAYKALTPKASIDQRNAGIQTTTNLNFAKADLIPDAELNKIIWEFVKGKDKPMPAPVRGAFVAIDKNKNEED